MPLRRLTARDRTQASNRQLAALLAFVAGAVDVSGYMAYRQFSSHMSGTAAILAADFDHFRVSAMTAPAAVLGSFLAGAVLCALIVNWERRRDRQGMFAVPVLVEAGLLCAAAMPVVADHRLPLLSLLAFAMGLQNAVITKVSRAEIRTTHITGMVTDIGIELGRAIYPNLSRDITPVRAQLERLLLLSVLVTLFFLGGIAGAELFPRIGMLVMLPLAALLAAPTVLPIAADLQAS